MFVDDLSNANERALHFACMFVSILCAVRACVWTAVATSASALDSVPEQSDPTPLVVLWSQRADASTTPVMPGTKGITLPHFSVRASCSPPLCARLPLRSLLRAS